MGIYTYQLALAELSKSYSYEEQLKAKNSLEDKIDTLLADKGEIISKNTIRNANTVNFIIYKYRADIVMMALDLVGVDVSSGSACSSGSIGPSRVLLAQGYSEEHAKNAVRLSLGPHPTEADTRLIWQKIEPVLSRYLD